MVYTEILERIANIVSQKSEVDLSNLTLESEYIRESESELYKNIEELHDPKLDNDEFVTKCYSILLGRIGEKEEIDTWEHAITQGLLREELIEQFQGSTEYNERFIKNCYLYLLGRSSDSDGVEAWFTRLRAGLSKEVMVNEFKGSAEYLERNTSLVDSSVELKQEKLLKGAYIDITSFAAHKRLTGIQRVVKEVSESLAYNGYYEFIIFDKTRDDFLLLHKESVFDFFSNPEKIFLRPKSFALLSDFCEPCVFVDLDSAWNTPHKRSYIYKELKKKRVKIVSYLYDLIPILKPEVITDSTLKDFIIYIAAILKYSDLIITDSLNTEDDLLNLIKDVGVNPVSTLVSSLGVRPYSEKDVEYNSLFQSPTEKFFLFVGTLEPRKKQDIVLDAFLKARSKNPLISMIFVGRMGWGDDSLKVKIRDNETNNVRWFSDVGDDDLRSLYKRAFVNIYISDYEGFGLPIAEGLAAGKPTLTSLNSSTYEAGHNFADYIKFNTATEVEKYMTMYLENQELYRHKKEYIETYYKPHSWEVVSERIGNAISQLRNTSILSSNKKLEKIQHVSISIRPDTYLKNILLQEKYGSFASEYVVITKSELISQFKKIKIKTPLLVIDELDIIKKESGLDFEELDHLQRNWLLRIGVISLEEIDDVFIMFDDDSFPLHETKIDNYIDKNGRYISYYFGNLLNWHHNISSFDKGMQRARNNSTRFNIEYRSYASHCPQIINKLLLTEAVDFMDTPNMLQSPSEWECYFNYATTFYPHLFKKTKAKVMNWPAEPSDWTHEYDNPETFQTENYYERLYENGNIFGGLSVEDQEEKLRRKKEQLSIYRKTIEENKKLVNIVKNMDLIHTFHKFEHAEGIQVFLSNIPKFIKVTEGTVAHVNINCKIINSTRSKLETSNFEINLIHLESRVTRFSYPVEITSAKYEEFIIHLPVLSSTNNSGEFFEVILTKNHTELSNFGKKCMVFVE